MKSEPTRAAKTAAPPAPAMSPTPPASPPRRRGKGIIFGVALCLLAGAAIYVLSGFRCVVPIGSRGIEVRSGRIATDDTGKPQKPLPPGTYLCLPGPFSKQVIPFSIRWSTVTITAPCLTDKLKPVTLTLRMSYRLPEEKLVEIYEEYGGDPFPGIVTPQIQALVKQEVQAHPAAEIASIKGRQAIATALKEVALPSMKKSGETTAASSLLDLRVDDIELPATFVSTVSEEFAEAEEKKRAKDQETQQFEERMALAKTKADAERLRTRLNVLTSDPVVQRLLEKGDDRMRNDLLSLVREPAESGEKKTK